MSKPSRAELLGQALEEWNALVAERNALKAEVEGLRNRINSRKIYYPLPTGHYEVGPDGVERFVYEQGETTASELFARAEKAEAALAEATDFEKWNYDHIPGYAQMVATRAAREGK